MDYQIQEDEQVQEEIHLQDYFRILSRRKRVILAVFFLVVGIAAVYAFSATPIYKGSTQILVDMERNQSLNFMEGGAALIQIKDPVPFFNTQKDLVTSRTFIDRVVRKLQLDKNPYFQGIKERGKNRLIPMLTQKIMGFFPQKSKPRNAFPDTASFPVELDPQLTNILLGNLEMQIPKQNNVFRINYYADNPVIAATLANGISEALIEYNLDIRVKPYRDAAEWLSAKLVESKRHVENIEKTLQEYREGKSIVSFETRENVITQRLQQLYAELVATEGKRQDAEIRYRQIESVIDKPDRLAAIPAIMNNMVIQGLRNEELNVKNQIVALSEKFGPKHPQIIGAETRLTALQKNIIAEARKMLTAFRTEYDIAKSRETSLQQSVEAQKQEVLDLSRKAINYNVISGESTTNKQFYDLLLKKYQEASLSSGIDISNIQVVDRATVNNNPVRPQKTKFLFLAVIAGLFGGVCAAFVVDYLDDTIKTPEDVEKHLKLSLLDVVPLTSPDKGPIFLSGDGQDMTAEAFRTIRTGLIFSDSVAPLKVILVTSSLPDEGKSMTAANLAVAMSHMGEKVLLMDCDMRRHSLHSLFDRHDDSGIVDLLLAQGKPPRAIQKLDEYAGLNFLSVGKKIPNPSELLGSRRMHTFMARMREHYDRVIIDSPPALMFSDPLILTSLSDGVILVVEGEKTRRTEVQKTIQRISGTGARIIGVVLNKLDITRSAYYPYSYRYAYIDKKDG